MGNAKKRIEEAAERAARAKLDALNALQNQTPGQPKNFGCLSGDNTKIKFSDGSEAPVVVSGHPISRCGPVTSLGNGTYYMEGRKPDIINVGAAPIRPVSISEQYLDNTIGSRTRKFWVYDWSTDKIALLTPPDTVLTLTNNNPFNYGAGVFPSGKHLYVYVYDVQIDSSLKIATDVLVYWYIYENFRIVDDVLEWSSQSDPSIFVSTLPTQSGQILLESGLPAIDPLPALENPPAEIINGESTYVFEEDPDYSYANTDTFYIGTLPTELFPDGAKTQEISLIATPREELNSQITLDFIGQMVRHKTKTKVMRQVSVTSAEASLEFSYEDLPASSYYMDTERLSGGSVNLLAPIGYVISSTLPNTMRFGTTPAAGKRMSIFGITGVAYPAPTEFNACAINASGTIHIVDAEPPPTPPPNPFFEMLLDEQRVLLSNTDPPFPIGVVDRWTSGGEFAQFVSPPETPGVRSITVNFSTNDGFCNIASTSRAIRGGTARIYDSEGTNTTTAFVYNTNLGLTSTATIDSIGGFGGPTQPVFCKKNSAEVAVRSLGGTRYRVSPYLNESTEASVPSWPTPVASDQFVIDVDNVELYEFFESTLTPDNSTPVPGKGISFRIIDSLTFGASLQTFNEEGELQVTFRRYAYNSTEGTFSTRSVKRTAICPSEIIQNPDTEFEFARIEEFNSWTLRG